MDGKNPDVGMGMTTDLLSGVGNTYPIRFKNTFEFR